MTIRSFQLLALKLVSLQRMPNPSAQRARVDSRAKVGIPAHSLQAPALLRTERCIHGRNLRTGRRQLALYRLGSGRQLLCLRGRDLVHRAQGLSHVPRLLLQVVRRPHCYKDPIDHIVGSMRGLSYRRFAPNVSHGFCGAAKMKLTRYLLHLRLYLCLPLFAQLDFRDSAPLNQRGRRGQSANRLRVSAPQPHGEIPSRLVAHSVYLAV